MKTSDRLLAFLATLGVLMLAAGLLVAWTLHRRSNDAEAAYRQLSELYAAGAPLPKRSSELDSLFMGLLKNPSGSMYLRKLSEQSPSIAFHEPLNTVFYLESSGGAFIGGKEEFSPHLEMAHHSSHGRPVESRRGCGVGQVVTLTGLKVDHDSVWIDFETSPDPKWDPALEKDHLEPGTKYRAIFAVPTLDRLGYREIVAAAKPR